MTELVFYIAAVVVLLGATTLILRGLRAIPTGDRSRLPSTAEFFPVHCRYFPQMRHALSLDDAAWLAGRGSPAVYRPWKKAVRRAGRMYLVGMREDFARLNRLARLVSLYSPQVRARQEAELLRLNLRFQLLYRMVLLRFWLGRPALGLLGQMASLIGSFGSRLEQAALALNLPPGAVTP